MSDNSNTNELAESVTYEAKANDNPSLYDGRLTIYKFFFKEDIFFIELTTILLKLNRYYEDSSAC